MTVAYDWMELAASAIARSVPTDGSEVSVGKIAGIIRDQCPYRSGVAYKPVDHPTLLQCIDCKNTESPAGAMGRFFNQGRCLHCGGFFKVVRA